MRARSAAVAIGGSLDREAAARDTAMRYHTGEVEQQWTRGAVEVLAIDGGAGHDQDRVAYQADGGDTA